MVDHDDPHAIIYTFPKFLFTFTQLNIIPSLTIVALVAVARRAYKQKEAVVGRGRGREPLLRGEAGSGGGHMGPRVAAAVPGLGLGSQGVVESLPGEGKLPRPGQEEDQMLGQG